MANNNIELKLVIDGKEAIANLQLTDEVIKRISNSFRQAKSETNSFIDNVNESFQRARNSIQGAKEMFSIFQRQFSEPVKLAVDYQNAQIAFEVLLGSADKAKKKMEEIAEFTAKTPFQLTETIDAARQLEVLTKGALSSVEGLTMVGDVAAGTGIKINELATHMGRLYAGMASGREVGMSLQRLSELGAITPKIRNEIEDLYKSGEVQTKGWKVIMQDFERYTGLMDKQSAALGGGISNFQDSLEQLKTAGGAVIGVGLSPLILTMTKMLDVVNMLPVPLRGIISVAMTLTTTLIGLRALGFSAAVTDMLRYRGGLAGIIPALLGTSAASTGAAGSVNAFNISLKGATASVKTFLSSNPIGWAIMAASAIAAIAGLWDLIGEAAGKAKNESQDLDKYAELSLEKLREELRKTNEALPIAYSFLNTLKREQQQIYNNAKSTTEIDEIAARIAKQESRINSLKFARDILNQKIKEKEDAIKESVEDQLKTLEKQLEIANQRDDRSTRLKQVEQDYQNQLKTIQEGINTNAITEKRANELRILARSAYNLAVEKINKDFYNKEREEKFRAAEKTIDIEANILEKTKQLQGVKESELTQIQIDAINKKIELYKKSGKDISEIEGQLTIKQIEYKRQLTEEALELEEKAINNSYELQQKHADYEDANGLFKLEITRNELLEKIELYKKYNKDVSGLNAQLLLNEIETSYKRRQLRREHDDELEAIQADNIANEYDRQIALLNIEEKRLLERAALYENNELLISEIKKKYSAQREEIQRSETSNVINITADAAKQISALYAESYKNSIESELQRTEAIYEQRREAIETEKSKRVETALTDKQRQRIEEEYAAKKEKLEDEKTKKTNALKKNQFEAEKKIKKSEAILNFVVAVANAWAQSWTLAPFITAIIGGIKAAQVALIDSQQFPALAKGGLVLGPGTETSDSILARLSKNEYVIKARAVKKYYPLINAINNEDYRTLKRLNIPAFASGGGVSTTNISNSTYNTSSSHIDLSPMLQELRDIKSLFNNLIKAASTSVARIDKYESAAIIEAAEEIVNEQKL